MTEVYDYLRLLFARIGEPHCPVCGRPIAGQSVEQIVDRVLALAADTRFMVMAPMVRGRKGEHKDVLEQIRGGIHPRGDRRRRECCWRTCPRWPRTHQHTIEVVVDRLVMRDDLRRRLTEVPGRRPPSWPTAWCGFRKSAARSAPGPIRRSSPAPSMAPRWPSSRHGYSRSTARMAHARRARVWASCPRSTRSWSSIRADAGRGSADPLGRPHHLLLRPPAAGDRRGVRDSLDVPGGRSPSNSRRCC